MKIDYLFIPENVNESLKSFPVITKWLPDVTKEGKTSMSFPKARKSKRQIYRILANQHYDHLVKLLENIETCLSNGYTNINLLKEQNIGNFSSAISEVQIASSLINKGFKVEGFDQKKGSGSVPDIRASKKNISFIAEIYKPRDFEGLNLFVDEIRLYLKYLDLPIDYECAIKYEEITYGGFFDPAYFDPWEFSISMENQKYRFNLEQKIFLSINQLVNDSHEKLVVKEFNFKKFNLKIKLEINMIKKSKGNYPKRWISYLPPSLNGYAPDLMFDLLLSKKISKKLKKAQIHTISGVYLRILIVDITGLCYAGTGEFDHFAYLPKFKDSLYKHLVGKDIQADFIVFCLPNFSDEIIAKLIFAKNDRNISCLYEIFGDVKDDIIIYNEE